MQKKTLYFAASLAMLVVLFASLSMLSGRLLRGLRVDLSENHLYTLSEGTRNVLADLEEPVNIYLFFSQESSRDLPQIRSYAQRVDELLDEFANRSGGKLRIHRVDPEPFSEKEDEAAVWAAGSARWRRWQHLYLGIATPIRWTMCRQCHSCNHPRKNSWNMTWQKWFPRWAIPSVKP
jgi:ABC-type uncharacterized transport system involved in gliding motility auxiliary subunit